MSTLAFDAIQADIQARLLADPFLAPITMLLEHDSAATAEQLQSFEKDFEDAIATKGLVLGIKTPHFIKHDSVRGKAIAMRAVVAVVIFENPAANRVATGHQKTPDLVLQHAMDALLPAYDFEEEPLTPPALIEELYSRALLANTLIDREIP
jgi:hypothetical protein